MRSHPAVEARLRLVPRLGPPPANLARLAGTPLASVALLAKYVEFAAVTARHPGLVAVTACRRRDYAPPSHWRIQCPGQAVGGRGVRGPIAAAFRAPLFARPRSNTGGCGQVNWVQSVPLQQDTWSKYTGPA
eukprot:357891-Chlamydomonas_euryale.AAC.1